MTLSLKINLRFENPIIRTLPLLALVNWSKSLSFNLWYCALILLIRVKGITFTLDPESNKKVTFVPLLLLEFEYKRPLWRGHGSLSWEALEEMLLRMWGESFLLTSLLEVHLSSDDSNSRSCSRFCLLQMDLLAGQLGEQTAELGGARGGEDTGFCGFFGLSW